MTTDVGVTGTTMASGITWMLLAKLGRRAVNLVGLAVLARILMPEDFGLVAFAASFMLYLETIDDLGTSTALIYWPSDEDDVAQITFVLSVVLGFAWFGITWLCAPYVGEFFRNPEAEAVLKALAWSFPIRALGNTHEGLSYKRLLFRARIVPEISMALVKASVSVGLAFAGYGVWALVWGQLTGMAAWAGTLWMIVPWRPRLRLRVPIGLAPRIFAYSKNIVIVNITYAIVQQADYVVVGRMFSAAALGYYQMAFKIPEMTILLLTGVASKVLFPSFSRLQDDPAAVRRAYVRTFRYVGLLILPAVTGLVVLATPAVVTVFGERWLPTVPLLRALALYAGIRAINTHSGDVLKATGRPGVLAAAGGIATVVVPLALIVGSRFDLIGVALTMAFVTAPISGVSTWAVCRSSGIRAAEVLAQLVPGTIVSAALAVVLLPLAALTSGLAPVVQLTVGLVVGCLVVVIAVSRVEPELISTLAPRGSRRPAFLGPAGGDRELPAGAQGDVDR